MSARAGAWDHAIDLYASTAGTAGLKPATIDLRARALRRFASTLDVSPWELTPEEYQERLSQLPQSPYRAALRSFYRWALRVGRVAVDPTAEASRLPQVELAPPAWETAIALFEQAQRAEHYQESTIDLRVRLVRLFAVQLSVSPFRLTWEQYRDRLDAIEVGPATRNTYRTAMRAFYHWAAKTKRVQDNPTNEPSLRAEIQRVSPAWEAELLPYQRYLRALGRNERSIRVTVSAVRRVAKELGDLPPYKVTLDDLLEALSSKGQWATETRRAHVTALRSFYGWAKAVKRVKRNPAKQIPPVVRSSKVVEPASEEAIHEAYRKADSRERLALRLSAELGMRRAEVAVVHALDLTGRDGDWWLLVHGKGSKQRRLPVPDDLAHALRSRGDGYAFPGNDDGHISVWYLGKLISDLLPEGVTMHKLRHRFATQTYRVDHDVFAVQQLLGHASPATTQRYVHADEGRGRRLVEHVALPI